MAIFDEKVLDRLFQLARIAKSQEEAAKLCANLSRVLEYVDSLAKVDTEGVAPCRHVLPYVSSSLRADLPKNTLSREEFLSNAPSHVGGMIRVPPVLKPS